MTPFASSPNSAAGPRSAVRSLLRKISATDWLIIGFALFNAVLYASVLPLWEGFDEPFHYSLVREYGRTEGLPKVGRSTVDGQVAASLKLVPLSHLMVRNLGGGITFDEYFRLPPDRRAATRSHLPALKPGLPGDGSNYEAQQAPLAYVVMAAFDRLPGAATLQDRVLRLRILAGVVSSVACALALFWLARLLELPAPSRHAAAFIAFSSQMFYATASHAANDWLVLPLFLLTAASGAAFLKAPSRRLGVIASALLSAALLTKASMLAVVPWLVLILFMRLRWRQAAFALWPLLAALPWYIRNIAVYGNLAGMHEFASQVRTGNPLSAALLVPWHDAITQMARQAVWTGNNSFTPMSRDLVFAMLALAAIAALSAAVQDWRCRIPAAEGLLWPLAGLLAASLAYAISVSFWFNNGVAFSAGPWYAQPLVLLLSVLLCSALARARVLGRLTAAAAVSLSAGALLLTWWVKLIPYYAGLSPSRSNIDGVWALYRGRGAQLASQLGETAMAPGAAILFMAALNSLLAAGLAVWIAWRILRARDAQDQATAA
ncbi:MAG: hypothetical protein IH602_01585 [Bryobacteraceae bacterium]|nr:hypothetical protein [Bryobacteraceae bacterium]